MTVEMLEANYGHHHPDHQAGTPNATKVADAKNILAPFIIAFPPARRSKAPIANCGMSV